MDKFVGSVVELSKLLLNQSKGLADLVNHEGTTEETVIESAKQAAGSTAKLYELISACPVDTSSDEEVFLQESLLSSSKEVRSSILELIQATKDTLLNPFDFSSAQKLQNCCNKVAGGIKEVITSVQSLEKAKKGGNKEKNAVMEQVNGTMACLKTLVDASSSGCKQGEFLDAAKKFAAALGSLMELASTKNLKSSVDSLKEAAQAILSASKQAFKTPSDSICQQQLEASRERVAEQIRALVTALRTSDAENDPMRASSGGTMRGRLQLSQSGSPSTQVRGGTEPDPSPRMHSPRPSVDGDAQLSRASASAASPTSVSAPVAVPSSPPISRENSRDGTADLKKEEVNGISRASPRIEAGQPLLPAPAAQENGHHEPLRRGLSAGGTINNSLAGSPTPGSPAAGNWTATIRRGAQPGAATGAASASSRAFLSHARDRPINDATQDIINFFCSNFASFKQEWDATPTASKASYLRLVSDKIDAEVKKSGGKSSSDQDQDQTNLESILALQNFAQLRMMGGMSGGLTLKKGRLARSASAIGGALEIKAGQPLGPQMKEASDALHDAVVDFIIQANFYALAEAKDNVSPKDLLDALKDLLAVCRKIVDLTLIYAKACPESMHKILHNTIKVIEVTPKEGTVEAPTVAAATGMAEKYVESSLRKRLYNQANAIRVLSIHLLATVNSFTENIVSHAIVLQIASAVKAVSEATTPVLNCVYTYHYLACNRSDTKADDEADVVNLVKESDVNIWMEKSTPSQAKFDWEIDMETKEPPAPFTNGSLNKLVAHLTSDTNLDNNFLKTFITTYQSFATPWKLLEKLLQRYNTPKQVPADRALPIKLRVAVVTKYWVENQFQDFEEDLEAKLFDFIENTLSKDEKLAKIAAQLKNFLTDKIEERQRMYQKVWSVPPTDLSIPAGVRTPSELFMALNDEEIARQLTLIDFTIFSSIETNELLDQAWNKDKLKHRAQNVLNQLTRLNRLSFWIPSMILSQEKVADRCSIWVKFIHVADILRKMNNYHTLMGIVAGLNNASLMRLRFTKQAVPPKAIQSFSVIEKLMHPQSSYKNYRAALHKSRGAILPYLGMYLQDLTFIEDGNPSSVNYDKINLTKRELIYKVLQEVKLYQTTPFTFPPVEPIRTFLSELPILAEKDLYEVSLTREPRDAVKVV